jgi:hypothetical protein
MPAGRSTPNSIEGILMKRFAVPRAFAAVLILSLGEIGFLA